MVDHTSNPITRAQARAALLSMLIMARKVDHLSVESLRRSYNLPPREIDRLLTAEMQRRGCA